jgi:aquaporin Z
MPRAAIHRDRPRLSGHPSDAPASQPHARGWHPIDWGCELAGTAFQLFLGFCVVALLESPRSPVHAEVPSAGLRLVLIGLAFGLLAAAVALSPVGRRSGAHLNPSVTVAFALRGHTLPRDVCGYVAAQVAGATLAAGAFRAALPGWAATVGFGRTAPEAGLAAWGVVGIEAGLTAGLLLTVFLMVSSPRTAPDRPAGPSPRLRSSPACGAGAR